MEELPAWQFTAAKFTAKKSRRALDEMWSEMIFGSSNRPSVILWGMQNEGRDVHQRRSLMQRVIAD